MGKRGQCLVEFWESGERVWIPFENLVLYSGVKDRFDKNKFGHAELFRLRNLAYALELWNENTGSMSQLDIDPLPHQIHLVHHILASGNLNWLIADDVGLGKTIETGMLLKALAQRGPLGRVLLVTPAGLTKQWQEELESKFGFDDFEIAGDDFPVESLRHWKKNEHVIVSMDKIKSKERRVFFEQLPKYDLVIFDEAHRLSERQYGMVMKSSDRFKLARELRKRTDSLLLLTATPHQGRQDSFKSLLKLIRPEMRDEIDILEQNKSILNEMMFRNHKEMVTDAEGNFVFHGKDVTTLNFPASEGCKAFDRELQKYLIEGYKAEENGGQTTRAIGFVMTVYRKLASSSIAAIHTALCRRLVRLKGEDIRSINIGEDERYSGELEEISWQQSQLEVKNEFFVGELDMLEKLISHGKRLLIDDEKLVGFMEKIIKVICKRNPNEKVLIFTEYRATQDYIENSLSSEFGPEKVALINGSMSHQERRNSIDSFENEGQFLVSTEAGGEGINLQRYCHTMVNFDLPWNPMRIAQRIGRLYRYGQKKKVVVFNLHVPQSLDASILETMYFKLDQIVADLASVGGEYHEGMKDDLLGQLVELVDVESVLEKAHSSGVDRTQNGIDEALQSAKDALKKQKDLFKYAQSYDALETAGALKVTQEHLKSFLLGMFELYDIEIVQRIRNDKVWQIKAPDAVVEVLNLGRHIQDISFDKEIANSRKNTAYAALEHPLIKGLLQAVKLPDFGGLTASVKNPQGNEFWSTSVLRWQNEQGKRLRREFIAVTRDNEGRWEVNSDSFSQWLLVKIDEGNEDLSVNKINDDVSHAYAYSEERLTAISTKHLHPESIQELGVVVTGSVI